MAKMKSLLRQTAASKQSKDILAKEVLADRSALIVPITLIKTDKNIRKNLTNIDELAESIKEHGILQALVVTKGWRLVSGHRRLEGARRAGLKEVPVRLADMDENTAAVAKVIENIQRENLSGVEEIEAIANLLPIFDGNQTCLSRALGKSQPYISRCCKAAKVLKEINYATSHSLSKSALLELADTKDPKKLADQIKNGEVKTVKDVREKKERSRPSPTPGGRYGPEGFLKFNERRGGKAFSLRLNVDVERTPPASVDKAIKHIEQILKRLKQMKGAQR